MQRVFADKYIEIGERLAGIRVVFHFTDQPDRTHDERRLSDSKIDEIRTAIKDLIKICDTISFKVSGDILSKAYDDLPRTGREFDLVVATVVSELKNQTFLYVPSHKAPFYENDTLVSVSVLESFPKASAELRMAGNCFATGLNTACVFHCMRAAEIGVWALGHALGVSFPDRPVDQADIHPILEQVDSKIKAQKTQARSAEKDEALKILLRSCNTVSLLQRRMAGSRCPCESYL
jgi:hypothetical protein